MRIGIVGARRGRQGIGEHVAWRLARLGATVPAIVGTRPETLAEAQRNLRERHGLETHGYLSLADMLRSERLDAVAICTPDRCHREQLRLALDSGLHVLCEKPLVFDAERDSAADARPLVEGFRAAGKLLMVNEQWPYTLPWFSALYSPGERGASARRSVGAHSGSHEDPPVRTLDMLLCPGETGAAMIPNALPHVLSLLLAVAPPGGEAREIVVRAARIDNGAAPELVVRFVYETGATAVSSGATAVSAVRDTGTIPRDSAVHESASLPPERTRGLTPPARLADSSSAPCLRDSVVSPPAPASGPAVASLPPERTRGLTPPARRDGEHATHVRAVLRQVAAQPRPAGYALDGQAVRRTIDMADYSMSLVAVDDLLGCEHHAIARPAEAATPSRRIAIPDPLQVLLEDFVARVASAEPPPADATLLDRLRLLDAVYRAAREQLASTTVDVRTADTAVAPGM